MQSTTRAGPGSIRVLKDIFPYLLARQSQIISNKIDRESTKAHKWFESDNALNLDQSSLLLNTMKFDRFPELPVVLQIEIIKKVGSMILFGRVSHNFPTRLTIFSVGQTRMPVSIKLVDPWMISVTRLEDSWEYIPSIRRISYGLIVFLPMWDIIQSGTSSFYSLVLSKPNFPLADCSFSVTLRNGDMEETLQDRKTKKSTHSFIMAVLLSFLLLVSTM